MNSVLRPLIGAFTILMASACAASTAPAARQPASILVSSTPAAGATVEASPESLRLHFDPPARLDEVKITGPQGTMPMMVHAVGEVADYDLPLSGVGPGEYVVEWRAMSGGTEHSGSFAFTVR